MEGNNMFNFEGETKLFTYEGSAYEENQEHGINGGKITALVIMDSKGKIVYKYDGQLDLPAKTAKVREVLSLAKHLYN
jgi:hypothetical protein